MDLFGRKAKKQVKELEEALRECNEKLMKRQEDINKTNAYWKSRIKEIKKENIPNLKKKS
jgi:hypothetical protein